MFEAVELGRKISKEFFKEEEPKLRQQLLEAQRAINAANIPVVIIVAGVLHAGKGEVVNHLQKWFDSRGIETHAFWDETDEENERPAFWRFWRRLPPRGQMCIMFGAWYTSVINRHSFGKCDVARLDEEARHISELERMLSNNGAHIIKLWFHLSQKTHDKRNKKHAKTAHHHEISKIEKKLAQRYAAFIVAAERTIRMTDNGTSPWYLIESDDPRHRDLSAGRNVLQALTHRLQIYKDTQSIPKPSHSTAVATTADTTLLDRVDLTNILSDKEYRQKLSLYQNKLNRLIWQAYAQKRSTVAVFEGWDAAGKGGAIRRVTAAIDARLYRTISIAAPTDEERNHHYLWRFWRHIPRSGYVTLYDRSWYGRVLVERVESFADPNEWQRAYQEINDFEEQLYNHGIVVCKFWLHISKEEQLRRFEERQQTPWKQHKITAEDWRNRENWDQYKSAVNEMTKRTSTAKCPWSMIAANDKRNARIEILKTICKRLALALGTD